MRAPSGRRFAPLWATSQRTSAQCNLLLGQPEGAWHALALLRDTCRMLEAMPAGKSPMLVEAMIDVAISGLYTGIIHASSAVRREGPHNVVVGQPLEYHRTADGRFVLYSIGWNAKDDGGVPGKTNTEGDWLWPFPPKQAKRPVGPTQQPCFAERRAFAPLVIVPGAQHNNALRSGPGGPSAPRFRRWPREDKAARQSGLSTDERIRVTCQHAKRSFR